MKISKETEAKLNEIVEEYRCYDCYGESCTGDCDECKDTLRQDLIELLKLRDKEHETSNN